MSFNLSPNPPFDPFFIIEVCKASKNSIAYAKKSDGTTIYAFLDENGLIFSRHAWNPYFIGTNYANLYCETADFVRGSKESDWIPDKPKDPLSQLADIDI